MIFMARGCFEENRSAFFFFGASDTELCVGFQFFYMKKSFYVNMN